FVKKFVPAALADQVVPTITCPTDIVQDAGPQCFISVTLTDPIASDNISTVFTFEGVRSDGAALDAPFPIGNTTITWTAKDGAGNVSEPCEHLVTIQDKTLPIITCPMNITETITQGTNKIIPIVNPIALDNCSAEFTYLGIRGDGLPLTDPFPLGGTNIQWTATDGAGNTSQNCLQQVMVSLAQPQILSVTSFVLVDADTDLDIMTITNGAIIHLASLPTTNLNVRANTTSDVRSVRLVLAGNLIHGSTESTAPYALYGDSMGNYAGQVFPLGNYRLTGTPYSAAALGGTVGTPLNVSFELSNNPACTDFTAEVSLAPFTNVQDISQPFALTGGLPAGGTYSGIGVSGGFFSPSVGAGTYAISYSISNAAGCSKSTSQNITVISNDVLSVASYVLVDADTDRDIMTITDGAIIYRPSLSTTNLNIRANTTSDVRSIRLVLSGTLNNGRTESTAPYALYGDSNGNYAGQVFPLGNYRLIGTPYSATGLSGTKGLLKSISFSLSDDLSCSDFTTVVSLAPLANVQDTSQSFALTGGLPTGGTYSGIGVSGGNFDPSVGAGNYSIIYTITNAAGCSKSTSQNITVISNNVLSVSSYVLVNADTDLDIMTISNGSSIDLGGLSATNLNIRANTTTDVQSIRLVLSGTLKISRTESVAPYALNGDSNGDYAGSIFPIGNYSLTGTPYSAVGLSGTLGTPLTINFELISAPGLLTAKQVNNMNIAPNPASYSATASFNLPINVKTIMVFDMIGRLVRTYKAEEVKNRDGYGLDLNFIQPGNYILKTIDDQGNQYQKQMAIDY
ncbi:HYR domain-containing protein, partial [Arenibacter sp. F26102]|uniref:HYR domain-containing protein n=1 Tax=Arenibacter sp. F26102 TaxID=2926416 RepID=UPI001FF3C2FF